MKKTRNMIKATILFVLVLACDSTLTYEVPTIECREAEISPTTTISKLKSMYKFGAPITVETDDIIEGYIVSNDAEGNIYKTIYIQDAPQNPQSAISISVDESMLFSKYNTGRKIYVFLKGLSIGVNYGRLQLGIASENSIMGIPSSEIDKYIIRSCDTYDIIPKKISISEIEPSMYNMLISIDNVQFSDLDTGNTFANAGNNQQAERILQEFDEECVIIGEIPLKTSGFSSFKNRLLPEGKGSIVAICGNYYDEVQLYIRSSTDLSFNQERCNYFNALKATRTINQIKSLFNGIRYEFGINEELIIEGFVVSSDEQGNFNKRLILQDQPENPTGGIQLLLNEENIYERYKFGDKLFVKLNSFYMDQVNGLLSIGVADGETIGEIDFEEEKKNVYNTHLNVEITPKEISVKEKNDAVNIGSYVQFNNVELAANELGKAFTFYSGNEDASRTLISCGYTERIGVFTNGNATFSNAKFPEGKGSIRGVLSNYLEIVSDYDVDFNEPYEICAIEAQNVLITEVADPKNSVSSRFVELFNADEQEINLSGWKLNKYTNGSISVASGAINLDDIIIPAKGYLIVANSGFTGLFNFEPDIVSSYISGNGDDVYELVNNIGETIDVFGQKGNDGNGTDWEYLDGRAIRKPEITKSNPIFIKDEWIIYSASSNQKIDHPSTGQNAPQDFNPGEH